MFIVSLSHRRWWYMKLYYLVVKADKDGSYLTRLQWWKMDSEKTQFKVVAKKKGGDTFHSNWIHHANIYSSLMECPITSIKDWLPTRSFPTWVTQKMIRVLRAASYMTNQDGINQNRKKGDPSVLRGSLGTAKTSFTDDGQVDLHYTKTWSSLT